MGGRIPAPGILTAPGTRSLSESRSGSVTTRSYLAYGCVRAARSRVAGDHLRSKGRGVVLNHGRLGQPTGPAVCLDGRILPLVAVAAALHHRFGQQRRNAHADQGAGGPEGQAPRSRDRRTTVSCSSPATRSQLPTLAAAGAADRQPEAVAPRPAARGAGTSQASAGRTAARSWRRTSRRTTASKCRSRLTS